MARTVAELDIDRQTAGDQVEEPTTVPPVTTATDRQEPQERQRQRQTSGRCGNESKSSETASTVSYPSQTPSTIGALPCNPDVEQKRWDRGCDNHFRVLPQEDKLVQSNLLLDSGAQLHACPIKCSGQKVPLPDPGILTASGARLQHDRGRLVTFKLPEGRLFYACEVQKPILPLGCLAQQGCWSDLRADTGTLFFPDKIHAKQSQTQLPKEESLFFVKGMLVAHLLTAGVSDEVAQESQMPIRFANAGRRGGTDACSSCNTQRSRHSGSDCAGTAQS